MADFATYHAAFAQAEIDVIAASVDGIDDAAKVVEEEHLTFPVAYGLEAEKTAALLGSYWEPRGAESFLHPADFIILPNRRIISATYSTAAVGRLEAKDVLGFVTFKRRRPPPFA